MRATVHADPDGWWTYGDLLGRFTSRWEPGAIRHVYGDRRSHTWFIPADPIGNGHALYARARTYGDAWWYVVLTVTAERAGVPVAESSLHGIESDTDRDHVLELVLDLADEAIGQARETLSALCAQETCDGKNEGTG